MIEAIKDLSVSYPFLPGSTVPDELKHIKDARIIFELPAKTYERQAVNAQQFYASLISIADSGAIFQVVCIPFGIDEQVTVPVTVGLFNTPGGNSYVLVDEPVTYTGSHILHPDCLLFFQKSPKLSVRERRAVTSSDTAGFTNSYSFGREIAFSNGNNVSVSGNDTTIILTGGEGNGLGIWMESPWIDINSSTLRAAAGLRTINGKQGNVLIAGSSSVSIEGTGGIELVINPLPSPEAEDTP